jgi:hypothetical protein
MAAPKGATPLGGVAQQGELAEVLHLESRLAERLGILELETARIRAAALVRRTEAEAAFDAQLDMELRELAARLESERSTRIQALARAGEAVTQRLRAIDTASVDALAEQVAARVLAVASEEPES